MSANPLIDTSQPFARIVISELQDLIASGFAVAEANATIVRFHRGNVEIDVYWGRSSWEVSAGVALGGIRYSLSELLRFGNADFLSTYRYPTATTEEGLATVVPRVADLLRTYGRPAFAGDDQIASQLESRRQAYLREFALDSLATVTRPVAEEAFRKHKFAKAAELYEKISERLSPSERKKLEYAKSKTPK